VCLHVCEGGGTSACACAFAGVCGGGGEGMMPVPKRTSQDIQHQQMYLVSARVRFYVDQISHGTSEDRGLNPGL